MAGINETDVVVRDVEISVIIPVYKCEGCLQELHARLTRTLGALDVEYEILFVDDRSPDDSWALIAGLVDEDSRVVGYRLSRNFGQHAAITAGLTACRGRWAVVMDGDLEDPPEHITRLYRTALEGYDIVYSRRDVRHHSLFRRAASKLFFGLLSALSKQRIDGSIGGFNIISRQVVEAALQIGDLDRQLLLVLQWLGFRHTSLSYDRSPRPTGTSSYSVLELGRHGIQAILFQTTVLLQWTIYLGFILSFAGGVCAVVQVVRYFSYDIHPGWTSLMVVELTLAGFIIISLGIVGLYIGRIFQYVKRRPLFVIAETTAEEKGSRATPWLQERSVRSG